MILCLLTILLGFAPQDTIPYKPSPEFELFINYNYSEKDQNIGTGRFDPVLNYHFRPVYWDKGSKPAFLTADLKTVKLSDDEVRYRIVDNNARPLTSQKIKAGNTIHFALGFIDDMKKGTAPNGYKIIFYSRDKVDISQIDIRILDDGAFIVNGEKRGQF